MNTDNPKPDPKLGGQKGSCDSPSQAGRGQIRKRNRISAFWISLSGLFVLTAGMSFFLYPQLIEKGSFNFVLLMKCKPLDDEGLKDLSLKAVGVAHVQTEKQVDEEVEKLFAPIYQRIPEYVDYRFSYKYRIFDKPIEFLKSFWGKASEKAFVQLMGEDFPARVIETQKQLNNSLQKNYENAFREQHPCPQFEDKSKANQLLEETAQRLISRLNLSNSTKVTAILNETKLKLRKTRDTKKLKWLQNMFKALKAGFAISGYSAGATTGAVVCAPLGGPVASSGCAAAGVVAVWVASDALLIMFEKGLTRDSMEKEIRKDIERKQKIFADDLKELLRKSNERFTLQELTNQHQGG